MNWITQLRRLMIYLRDGFVCQYCGYDLIANVDGNRRAELDHITPHNLGGGNESTNLITCCGGKGGCNNTRQDRLIRNWKDEATEIRIIAQAAKPMQHLRQTAIDILAERKAQRQARKAA